jgi:hypothetical protein
MFDASTLFGLIGLIFGFAGAATAIISTYYLRKQTRLMAATVEKEVVVNVTNQLQSPTTDGGPLRAYFQERVHQEEAIQHQLTEQRAQILDVRTKGAQTAQAVQKLMAGDATIMRRLLRSLVEQLHHIVPPLN